MARLGVQMNRMLKKMNIITIITHFFLWVYFNLIGCIVRNYGFNCMYAVKNLDISDTVCPIKTHLKWKILILSQSSYAILSITNQKFQLNPKILTLILAGCKYICGPARFHLQPCQTYVWPAKWVIIMVFTVWRQITNTEVENWRRLYRSFKLPQTN